TFWGLSAPVKSAVRQFKLVGTEESSALIINQVTEVAATQKTLQDKDSSNEDNDKDGNDNEGGKGDDDDSNNDNSDNDNSDNDNSDNDNAAMDVDSGKCLEETQPTAPTKATVTEVKAPAPVPLTKPNKMPFFKLSCTSKHVPFLLMGLQVLIQFQQNCPSVEWWQN
ncbi:hypothetical protein C0995_011996, partial [Termitomyces sp. Mi166